MSFWAKTEEFPIRDIRRCTGAVVNDNLCRSCLYMFRSRTKNVPRIGPEFPNQFGYLKLMNDYTDYMKNMREFRQAPHKHVTAKRWNKAIKLALASRRIIYKNWACYKTYKDCLSKYWPKYSRGRRGFSDIPAGLDLQFRTNYSPVNYNFGRPSIRGPHNLMPIFNKVRLFIYIFYLFLREF